MPFEAVRSRATTPLVLAASLALPLCTACGGPSPAVSVVPGLLVAIPAVPVGDTVVFRRVISRGGRDSIAGTRTVVRRIVRRPERAPLLEVEQRFPGGGGEIVDTALADLRTLRAVAHRSHQPKRTMRFTFEGDSALGTVSSVAAVPGTPSPTEAVHQGLGGPLFDSNLLELVVAALPLRSEFKAELPFFIYERGGRVAMPVAVRERARIGFPMVGEREAWVVAIGVPGAPATLWVDTASRAVLRVRYDIAASATSFTDERITPLPS